MRPTELDPLTLLVLIPVINTAAMSSLTGWEVSKVERLLRRLRGDKE